MERHGAVRSKISSKVAYTNISHKLGAMAKAFSYKVVVRSTLTDPNLRIAGKAEIDSMGRSIPAKAASPWLPPTQSQVASRQGQAFLFLEI